MENKLSLYMRSKDFLWTDRHVAEGMLKAHLDVNHDAASRNPRAIEKAVNWIHGHIKSQASIVDLGCGPGLYAEKFARLGHQVTGIDISSNSIEYAKGSALKQGLSIKYTNGNYLEQIEGEYDIALCIYCDFGALIPVEQTLFLDNVHKCLKENGILIFDVFSIGLSDELKEKRDFSIIEEEDFWSKEPHIVLSETVFFEEEIAWGHRNIIVDTATGVLKEFITWDTLYTEERIKSLLSRHGFEVEVIKRGLVGANNFTSDDVLFVKAIKRDKHGMQ